MFPHPLCPHCSLLPSAPACASESPPLSPSPATWTAYDCFSRIPLSGDLDSLLEAYDRERRTVPSPVDFWQWGWTKSAETWNGRLAMLAILAVFGLELVTGQSILKHVSDLE